MAKVPTIKLNNGYEMPVLGIGTYCSTRNECENAVKLAIDFGYRHIDTAYVYRNEKEVGNAINEKITQGTVKREELFVVTKLGGLHHDPQLVEHACRESLQNLNLNYIDLYLIHFPVGNGDFDYVDTWKAMEKLVKIGLARSIGLSNFNSKQTDRVLEACTIKPVTNQVECHPGFNQKRLIEFSKQRGIVITAYCPLGRPNPTTRQPSYLFNDTIASIAQKYNKTPAQIVLRYLLQLEVIPIPKSVTPGRIQENIQVFDFKLKEEDVEQMDRFDTGRRMIPFDGMRNRPHYPFNVEF